MDPRCTLQGAAIAAGVRGMLRPSFSRETLASMLDSGLDKLLRDHHAEVAHDKERFALNPDWTQYFQEEIAGRFLGFSLRRNGALIGYTGFFVLRSLHYAPHVFAMNDVIYLRPDERGLEGVGLIIEAERALKVLGADKVFYHTKVDAVLGQAADDSLDAIDNRLEIEERFGIELPEHAFAIGDMTLAAVLKWLGYRHSENHLDKVLA